MIMKAFVVLRLIFDVYCLIVIILQSGQYKTLKIEIIKESDAKIVRREKESSL